MAERKFQVGDKVIGNARARCYGITGPGWVGIVEDVLLDGQIKVRGIEDSWNCFNVRESCFDKLIPAEPKRNEDGKVICEDCGKPIDDDHNITWVNGRAICKDCIKTNYKKCVFCGEYYATDELEEIDGVLVCQYCIEDGDRVFECDHCGDRHLRSLGEYGYAPDVGTICKKCMDSGDFVRCDDCGRWFYAGDVNRSRRDGRMRCAGCERSLKAKCIKEYGYKPDPIFKLHNHPDFFIDNDIKELLFGVELEIDKGENREDCAEELLDTSPDIYCKRDGSLCNGIEIVTHPCTLEYHLKDLGWDKLSEVALKYGFSSQDARTCGLHVHVGRKQMGKNMEERKETAAKIVLLVDRHWDSLVKFSRRKAEQLSRWASRPNIDYEDVADGDITLIEAALATKHEGRYQAVNLENRNTVEFRLFNGTLKVGTIYATLELVSRIVNYAKSKSAEECMVSSWKDIVNGNIIENAEYKELAEYLETRELTKGMAPSEFNWKPREDEKYKVGDKVKVVNDRGGGVGGLRYHIGEIATVVAVGLSGYDYAIDFGTEGEKLHNCGKLLPGETGYLVYSKNLVRYDESAEVESGETMWVPF